MLHEAAVHGNHKAIVTLLAQGSEIDQQNETGNTALHLAALNGKTGVTPNCIHSYVLGDCCSYGLQARR